MLYSMSLLLFVVILTNLRIKSDSILVTVLRNNVYCTIPGITKALGMTIDVHLVFSLTLQRLAEITSQSVIS